MPHRKLIAIIAVVTLPFFANFAAAGGMRLTGSDQTASFMPLGLNKSVVVDLPSDIDDVLVSQPKIVNVIVRSKRRVYVIGLENGQANVYFFGANGRQIGALDISVVNGTPKPPSESNPAGSPANVVVVFRGNLGESYSCTPTTCIGPQKKDTTTYSQITHVP